ncbi:hypothetical protein LAZ67_2003304 [Cordylochernes scorpioides]|uniref:Mariner Mos1 transposase n=1 Tax=Cordylochernes scorpioides TaxID=51811 RepID=A0ABY6K2Y3_9ARAC|nr:hypothetical protein LAZ67_2003304 [Cordylochernes scorpioides]
MLITFFDSRGIIHKEFVPAGRTITGDRIRPEYRDEDSWCLLHDNAPSHSSLIVCRFLAKNNVCVSNNPPYSPALAPCDFYLFPKIKLKREYLDYNVGQDIFNLNRNCFVVNSQMKMNLSMARSTSMKPGEVRNARLHL